ncbi:HEAT repeat domain-containing protein [Candidatus Poribacteria bacterium]|nr:HEAT repeat domain-containing protein [Candidatus Poribacteria bacterium]
MVFWKEWRETLPMAFLSLIIICILSHIRWEGWRLEFFEIQFWAVTILCLTFSLLFLGAGAIAGERENNTFEGLLARPVGLLKVFAAKYTVRSISVAIMLPLLIALFHFLRPTHNLNLYDVAKGMLIAFSFLLFALTLSFCISSFTDTTAKAFVASIILIFMALFAINSTPFFRYAWWWSNSIEEMWLNYLFFYGALSAAVLAVTALIFRRRATINYDWKHLGVAGVLCFLVFVRSVSTTFWLIPRIAISGDLTLVSLCRQPVEKVLDYTSTHKGNSTDLVRQYVTSSHDARIDYELIQQLANPSARIRNEALNMLIRRKTEAARTAVIPLLKDSDDQVSHSALLFVKILKCDEAAPGLVALLHDPNSSIRQRAVIALGAVKDKEAGAYLVEALKDRNPRVSSTAAIELCRLDYGEAQPEIVRMMFENPVKHTRETIAHWLGMMKSAPACDALITALSDENPRLVESAIASLGELRCEDAVRPLLTIYYDSSFWNKPGFNPSNRASVFAALKKIGNAEVKKEFQELFAQPDLDPATKMEIAVSLVEIGDTESLPYLRERMAKEIARERQNYQAREYAIRLAKAGDYSGVPVLIPWIEGGFPGERYRYGKVLEELTGKKYGWDSKKWEKWWEANQTALLETVPEGK